MYCFFLRAQSEQNDVAERGFLRYYAKVPVLGIAADFAADLVDVFDAQYKILVKHPTTLYTAQWLWQLATAAGLTKVASSVMSGVGRALATAALR